MKNGEVLTLAHPKVQEVKRRFESVKKRKNTRSFEELFGFFQEESLSLGSVAQLCGVTEQSIHEIYQTYFQEIFGSRTDRYAKLLKKRRQTRKIELKATGFPNNLLTRVAIRARLRGCKVHVIPFAEKGAPSGVLRRRLLINDHVCLVVNPCAAHHTSKHTKRWYVHTHISIKSLTEVDALIVFLSTKGFAERIFVVPGKDILRCHSRQVSRGSKNVSLTIPLEKLPAYHNMLPYLDYWQFEDAWQLLPPKQTPAA